MTRKRHLTLCSLLVLTFLSTVISCCIFSSQTFDYKLDSFYYSLNNYNTQTRLDGYNSPILKCVSDSELENKTQLDLFKTSYDVFYYNVMAESCRLEISSETTTDVFGDPYSIKLLTQSHFWITKNEKIEEGYYLEDGQYLTYFDQSVIENGSMFNPRFDADTFIFISDSFADELVAKHNITADDPYKTLINNKEYSLFNITNNDTGVSFTVSINNILHSKYRKAPSTTRLFGNSFGLINFNKKMNNLLKLSLSISLKTNPYNFKTILKTIMTILDSNVEDIEFELYTYSFNGYSLSAIKTNELNNIIKKKYNDNLYNTLFYCMVIIGIGCYSILLYLILKSVSKKMVLLIGAVVFCCFSIYGIVSNFIYIYPEFSVFPVLVVIVTSLILLKKLFHKGKIRKEEMGAFYEINI